MFDLNHLKDYIEATTEFNYVEFLNFHTITERNSELLEPACAIAYGRTQSTSEPNIILGSYSEINNNIIQFVKVVINCNYQQHLKMWSQIFKSLSNYHPVFPPQTIEPNSFTFVDCDYNQDNNRIISEFTWGFMFDRTWVGDILHTHSCVKNTNPNSIFNQYNYAEPT